MKCKVFEKNRERTVDAEVKKYDPGISMTVVLDEKKITSATGEEDYNNLRKIEVPMMYNHVTEQYISTKSGLNLVSQGPKSKKAKK